MCKKVDAVLKRVTQRSQETIKLKQIYIQDSTGEVKVSMWRQLAETSIEVWKTENHFLKTKYTQRKDQPTDLPSRELVSDEEQADTVIEGMIPFNAVIVVSGNNTISSVTMD
ncbi:Hypothetical predicted protein [Mytilus galloprovincialis]|uniref:OB domain-containing protein n=1 Tax=Mytilus galloprovincialis TaxID=29158 RepID=A0A8B6GQ38_MYTGA|nr:Hypothetical predicted protein [Mytilus galloprovincialis]